MLINLGYRLLACFLLWKWITLKKKNPWQKIAVRLTVDFLKEQKWKNYKDFIDIAALGKLNKIYKSYWRISYCSVLVVLYLYCIHNCHHFFLLHIFFPLSFLTKTIQIWWEATIDTSAVVHMSFKNTFVELEKTTQTLMNIWLAHFRSQNISAKTSKKGNISEPSWSMLSTHTVISFNEAVADVWYVKYHDISRCKFWGEASPLHALFIYLGFFFHFLVTYFNRLQLPKYLMQQFIKVC